MNNPIDIFLLFVMGFAFGLLVASNIVSKPKCSNVKK